MEVQSIYDPITGKILETDPLLTIDLNGLRYNLLSLFNYAYNNNLEDTNPINPVSGSEFTDEEIEYIKKVAIERYPWEIQFLSTDNRYRDVKFNSTKLISNQRLFIDFLKFSLGYLFDRDYGKFNLFEAFNIYIELKIKIGLDIYHDIYGEGTVNLIKLVEMEMDTFLSQELDRMTRKSHLSFYIGKTWSYPEMLATVNIFKNKAWSPEIIWKNSNYSHYITYIKDMTVENPLGVKQINDKISFKDTIYVVDNFYRLFFRERTMRVGCDITLSKKIKNLSRNHLKSSVKTIVKTFRIITTCNESVSFLDLLFILREQLIKMADEWIGFNSITQKLTILPNNILILDKNNPHGMYYIYGKIKDFYKNQYEEEGNIRNVDLRVGIIDK